MNGLLYKEFKQNQTGVLVTILVPFLVLLLPVVLTSSGLQLSLVDSVVSIENESATLKFLLIMATYLMVGDMQGKTLIGDDTKKWGIFVVSNPVGIKGYLYTKYIFIFGMCGLMFVSGTLADYLYCTIGYQVTKQDIGSMSVTLVLLFYAQLLLRAIELPFFIRFGIKSGTIIKIITGVLLVVLLIVFVLLNPFDIVIKIVGFVDSLRSGNVSDALSLMIAIFPFIALGTYYFSYRVSCKVYMKGVEQYDK